MCKIKIISIICLISICLTLALIIKSQVTGYELSIYTNIPFVWFFLIISICGGVSIIVYSANKNGNLWMIGFFILILSNFIILSLPALRGYFLYNPQDPLTHIRITKDILMSGSIDGENFYPALHILLSNISFLSNISPIIIARYIPAFFSFLYVVYIYILSKSLFQYRMITLLVLASATTLLSGYLNVSIYPEGLGFFTLPLMFYLYFKMSKFNSIGYKTLFVILLCAYPFIHPRSSLMIIIFLIAIEIGKIICASNNINNFILSLKKISGKPVLMSIIAFFSWLSLFSIFGTKVRSSYELFIQGIVISKDPHFISATNSIQLEVIDIIEFFMKMTGHIIIYLLISFISILIIIKSFLRGNKEFENLVLLVIWIIIGESLIFTFFLSSQASVFTRAINTDILISLTPIFVGFGWYNIYKKFDNNKKIVSIVIIFVITFSSSIAIFSLYRSPYIFQVNWQITYEDVKGINWLIVNKIQGLLYSGLGLPAGLQSVVLTSKNYNRDDFIKSERRIAWSTDILDHFGYDKFESLGEQATKDYYMIITQRFKLANADIGLKRRRVVTNNDLARWNFNNTDFIKLSRDDTVEQIYSNGEFDIFLVHKDSFYV